MILATAIAIAMVLHQRIVIVLRVMIKDDMGICPCGMIWVEGEKAVVWVERVRVAAGINLTTILINREGL
jgi:hypothetical protein